MNLLVYASVIFADTYDHHGWWDSGADGWWWLMMIGMALFWVAVVVGVVLLARMWFTGDRGKSGTAVAKEEPAETLRRRLAEGEISIEDYRDRLAVLESSQHEGKQ